MNRPLYLLASVLLVLGCSRANPLGPVTPTAADTIGGGAPDRLTGRVIDTIGNPIQGAAVVVAGTNINGDAPTGSDGSYRISNASPTATLAVAATKAGFVAGTTAEFTGTSAPDLVLTPAAGGIIIGKVQSGSGGNIAGAEVWVNDRRLLVQTNNAGEFTISGVTLSNPCIIKSRTTGYSVAEQTVILSTTQNYYTGVLLTLSSGSALTGIVRNAQGTPVSNAKVTDLASGQFAITSSSGNYALANMAIGTGTIRVTAPGYQTTDQNVLVTAGSSNQGDVIVYAVAGTLAGTVLSVSGTAVVGATVSVLGTAASSTTDPSGSYVISNVPAGTYNVRASAFVSGNIVQTEAPAVVVSPGQTTVKNFVLQIGYRISGKVTGNYVGNTTGVPSARVRIVGANIGTVIVTADAFGSYDFGTIVAETVTLTVGKGGWNSDTQVVSFSPADKVINVALTGKQTRVFGYKNCGSTDYGNFNGYGCTDIAGFNDLVPYSTSGITLVALDPFDCATVFGSTSTSFGPGGQIDFFYCATGNWAWTNGVQEANPF